MSVAARRLGGWLVAGAVLGGCEHPPASPDAEHEHPQAHGHDHGHDEDSEREAVVVTTWTEGTELFVEFPALVVDEDSPFAAHLTWLDGFRPVATGEVTVVLSGGGAPDERFSAEPSATAGIFRPVARPTHATTRTVTVVLEVEGRRWEHAAGTHAVVASLAEAPAAGSEDDDGSIALLKEQQWVMPFSTRLADTSVLRPSLSAFARIEPRADGEVEVSAPATGRLVPTGEPIPVVGSHVEGGDLLARFVPRLEGAADVPSLDLAASTARLDVEQTTRERKRLEGLLADGAVPERRVVEARHAEAEAKALLDAANRRLGQFRRVQRTGGRGGKTGIEVRTPLPGTVLRVDAVAGALVEDGDPLFHIVDERSLWLSVRVPEIDADHVERITGVWFLPPGASEPIEVGAEAIVMRGRQVDPRTRTIEVIFTVPNEPAALRVGSRVQAHLLLGPGREVVSVPREAVLFDEGLEVVFVQLGGESFERRQVQTGIRDRGQVEILSGVSAGERVVVDGAHAVKLASASTTAPAHGHPH